MTETFVERYVRAQLDGDRAAAMQVIEDALEAGVSVPDVHLQILQAAQYEIGRLWETNSISVATEHQATAISQLALARLYERLPRRPRNGKRVLVSCVEGELHDMGSRLAADFLEMDGFDVRLLGANVPPESLVERIDSYRPHVVALSATMSFHLPALEQAIAAIRGSSRPTVPILVGGRAFTLDDRTHSLDVQGYGADALSLVAEAHRLTA